MSLFDRAEKLKFHTEDEKQGLPRLPEVTSAESLEKWGLPSVKTEVTRGYLCGIIRKKDYTELATSGKTDMEADHLDAAIFLFALNKVRQTSDEEFMAMGQYYCKFWRKILDPEAWTIIREEISNRKPVIEWRKQCRVKTSSK